MNKISENTLKKIEERFEQHLISVVELINFDRFILDYSITQLDSLNNRLKTGPFDIINPSYLAENTLLAIQNIRKNDSLRVNYHTIFNSCLVLQVSYFTSIIEELFYYSLDFLNNKNKENEFNWEEVKQKNDINFQNMPSIIKTFKNYLDIEIKKDNICNTVTLALLSRHTIVHSLSKVDQKFLNKIHLVTPRDIKQKFILGERIQFSDSELEFVRISMLLFITNICENVKNKYNIH